jgi:hypothetical protein
MYRGRLATSIENDQLRVTVLHEGGHLAEIHDKTADVNPLWTPPWDSREPSSYVRSTMPEYGSGSDARLLAGIMGHNICLDIFGGPSDAEAAAGLAAHGEAAVHAYLVAELGPTFLSTRANLPEAQLVFERVITLHGRSVRIQETVENLSACDRPIGWTQHVTLGPPFLKPGETQFRASATRSKVFEQPFGTADYLTPGAEFDWPMAPAKEGGSIDLRLSRRAAVSSAYTTHLMAQDRDDAYFVAFAPASGLAFGYVWKREDFPWLGIWEENHSRTAPPWMGRTLTRGMEFGVSPMPETRRQMIDRGTMFGTSAFRWIPARTRVAAEYWVLLKTVEAIPEALEWPDLASVSLSETSAESITNRRIVQRT